MSDNPDEIVCNNNTVYMEASTEFLEMLKKVNDQTLVDRFSNNIYGKTFPELFTDYAQEANNIFKCFKVFCKESNNQKLNEL